MKAPWGRTVAGKGKDEVHATAYFDLNAVGVRTNRPDGAMLTVRQSMELRQALEQAEQKVQEEKS